MIHPGRVVAVGFACFLAAILLLTRMDTVMMANNYDGSITMEVTVDEEALRRRTGIKRFIGGYKKHV